jgi:hypothetical protein
LPNRRLNFAYFPKYVFSFRRFASSIRQKNHQKISRVGLFEQVLRKKDLLPVIHQQVELESIWTLPIGRSERLWMEIELHPNQKLPLNVQQAVTL